MTSILQDILNPELTEQQASIVIEQAYSGLFSSMENPGRSKTPMPAATLNQFYDYVRRAIRDRETRANLPEKDRIRFTEEETDLSTETETITFSLIRQMPGQFSGGPPMTQRVQNLKPLYRESGKDDTDPGSRYMIAGYWYDNLVRFTCWARTNKAANARSEWFQDLMEEYAWWFGLQGVNRVIFWERNSDIVAEIDNNRWYGRPIDFFVRTEKLRVFREETMKEILIKLQVDEQ